MFCLKTLQISPNSDRFWLTGLPTNLGHKAGGTSLSTWPGLLGDPEPAFRSKRTRVRLVIKFLAPESALHCPNSTHLPALKHCKSHVTYLIPLTTCTQFPVTYSGGGAQRHEPHRSGCCFFNECFPRNASGQFAHVGAEMSQLQKRCWRENPGARKRPGSGEKLKWFSSLLLSHKSRQQKIHYNYLA